MNPNIFVQKLLGDLDRGMGGLWVVLALGDFGDFSLLSSESGLKK